MAIFSVCGNRRIPKAENGHGTSNGRIEEVQIINETGKVILDAGTGFGWTTLEINPESFKHARKLLRDAKLPDIVTFVKADLSYMPPIENEKVTLSSQQPQFALSTLFHVAWRRLFRNFTEF
jgi:ubiquinone/menaquinone biosynthesis C-methylase UbiE